MRSHRNYYEGMYKAMRETTAYISCVDKKTKVLPNVIDIFATDKFIMFTRKSGDQYVINIDHLVCYSVDPWHGSDDETDD